MRTDARERRQRIIDAACDLFRTTHPSEVTLEQVAERAQVGVATLYRNFPDRETLALSCALHILEAVEDIELNTLHHLTSNPDHVESTWRQFISAIVNLGVGPLVPALAPDSFDALGPQGEEHRRLVGQHTQAILDIASQHGLVSPNLATNEFITHLTVLTRPPIAGVHSLNPKVTSQLVSAYLDHQRTLGQAHAAMSQ